MNYRFLLERFLETALPKPPSKANCPPLHKDHVLEWAKRSSTDASNFIQISKCALSITAIADTSNTSPTDTHTHSSLIP